jgi:hypothetical protein
MTPEQIQNWRNILCLQLGPYAFIMRDEDIVAHRDMLQSRVDALSPEDFEEPAQVTQEATIKGVFNTSLADKLKGYSPKAKGE